MNMREIDTSCIPVVTVHVAALWLVVLSLPGLTAGVRQLQNPADAAKCSIEVLAQTEKVQSAPSLELPAYDGVTCWPESVAVPGVECCNPRQFVPFLVQCGKSGKATCIGAEISGFTVFCYDKMPSLRLQSQTQSLVLFGDSEVIKARSLANATILNSLSIYMPRLQELPNDLLWASRSVTAFRTHGTDDSLFGLSFASQKTLLKSSNQLSVLPEGLFSTTTYLRPKSFCACASFTQIPPSLFTGVSSASRHLTPLMGGVCPIYAIPGTFTTSGTTDKYDFGCSEDVLSRYDCCAMYYWSLSDYAISKDIVPASSPDICEPASSMNLRTFSMRCAGLKNTFMSAAGDKLAGGGIDKFRKICPLQLTVAASLELPSGGLNPFNHYTISLTVTLPGSVSRNITRIEVQVPLQSSAETAIITGPNFPGNWIRVMDKSYRRQGIIIEPQGGAVTLKGDVLIFQVTNITYTAPPSDTSTKGVLVAVYVNDHDGGKQAIVSGRGTLTFPDSDCPRGSTWISHGCCHKRSVGWCQANVGYYKILSPTKFRLALVAAQRPPCETDWNIAYGYYTIARCPLGTYVLHPGAKSKSECEPCGKGSYSEGGPCSLCPQGKYSTSATSSECLSCPPNAMKANPDRTGCLPNLHYYRNSTLGPEKFQACPAGTQGAAIGPLPVPACNQGIAGCCMNCTANTYSGGNGARCSVCLSNKVARPWGTGTTCITCQNGRSQDQTGYCIPRAHYYLSDKHATLGQPCPPNTERNASSPSFVGPGSCSTCAFPKVWMTDGEPCSDCPPSEVSIRITAEDRRSCVKCRGLGVSEQGHNKTWCQAEDGYYMVTGTSAKPCTGNTYSSSEHALGRFLIITDCLVCPPGSGVLGSPQTACKPCNESGSYMYSSDGQACSRCPPGLTPNTDRTLCLCDTDGFAVSFGSDTSTNSTGSNETVCVHCWLGGSPNYTTTLGPDASLTDIKASRCRYDTSLLEWRFLLSLGIYALLLLPYIAMTSVTNPGRTVGFLTKYSVLLRQLQLLTLFGWQSMWIFHKGAREETVAYLWVILGTTRFAAISGGLMFPYRSLFSPWVVVATGILIYPAIRATIATVIWCVRSARDKSIATRRKPLLQTATSGLTNTSDSANTSVLGVFSRQYYRWFCTNVVVVVRIWDVLFVNTLSICTREVLNSVLAAGPMSSSGSVLQHKVQYPVEYITTPSNRAVHITAFVLFVLALVVIPCALTIIVGFVSPLRGRLAYVSQYIRMVLGGPCHVGEACAITKGDGTVVTGALKWYCTDVLLRTIFVVTCIVRERLILLAITSSRVDDTSSISNQLPTVSSTTLDVTGITITTVILVVILFVSMSRWSFLRPGRDGCKYTSSLLHTLTIVLVSVSALVLFSISGSKLDTEGLFETQGILLLIVLVAVIGTLLAPLYAAFSRRYLTEHLPFDLPEEILASLEFVNEGAYPEVQALDLEFPSSKYSPNSASHKLVSDVESYFDQFDPEKRFEITRIRVLHNQDLNGAFRSRYHLLKKQERKHVAQERIHAIKRNEDNTIVEHIAALLQEPQRTNILRVLETTTFTDSGADNGLDCLLHGVRDSPEVLYSIANLGMLDLAYSNLGFFGRGMYLTHYPKYARFYSGYPYRGDPPKQNASGEECFMMAWVLKGSSFPLTTRMDSNHPGNLHHWHSGVPGFDSHYALVTDSPHMGEPISDYDPPVKFYADELVVWQENQILPRFLIYYRHRDNDSVN